MSKLSYQMYNMGDLPSPKRLQLVTERLRRRYETYKRDHKNFFNRSLCNSVRLYESQRQETQLMHQKWVESRAKKAAKNVRVSRETVPGPPVQVTHFKCLLCLFSKFSFSLLKILSLSNLEL